MEEIYKTSKDITMVIVAHRLSSLIECDQILELKNGNVVFHKNINEL